MKKAIAYWQMVGFLFTAVIGTGLHFLFDLTGGSVIAALFSAVNESIWEHLKLLFYPMVAFGLIEYLVWGKHVESFWCVKLLGSLLGLLVIPVVYYTYTGILGISVDWFNIAIFFLAAGVAYWAETKLFTKEFHCNQGVALALICLLAVGFTLFTFFPPHIPFFCDPVTGNYGFLSVQ